MGDVTSVRGSCLCGDVRFSARGPLSLMTHCHCSMCRKAHAAPFATYVAARASGFELHDEHHRIASHRSSAATERRFCARCGSVVPEQPGAKYAFMPAGLLDDDPGVRPMLHIFAGSKAPWYRIADGVPEVAAYPEGWDAAVVERTAERATDAGYARGSCLCGRIVYEVQRAEDYELNHCHCSRCRKARAAAHTSNMFFPLERLRFVSGRDERQSYKLPDAERFTHWFCASCGGGAPVEARNGRAMVPAATLDEDPGIVKQQHIFVGSMASWDVLGDDGWPRFERYAT